MRWKTTCIKDNPSWVTYPLTTYPCKVRNLICWFFCLVTVFFFTFHLTALVTCLWNLICCTIYVCTHTHTHTHMHTHAHTHTHTHTHTPCTYTEPWATNYEKTRPYKHHLTTVLLLLQWRQGMVAMTTYTSCLLFTQQCLNWGQFCGWFLETQINQLTTFM